MLIYIIIHHTYKEIQTALFKNDCLVDSYQQDNHLTSKNLIPMLDALCAHNNITIADVAFIGVNQGPGMFSTLRSIIATINGIHYATKIPLVGVDALHATAQEFYNPTFDLTLTLFNAYNQELYYLLTHGTTLSVSGYGTIKDILLITAQKAGSNTIYCIGDGATLYKKELQQNNSISLYIPEPTPHLCSLSMIGRCALEKYRNNNNNGNSYLFPLHLKKHAVER